jgi:hypothetical protein
MRTGVMITPLPIPRNPDRNPPNNPVAKIVNGSKNAPITGKNNLNIKGTRPNLVEGDHEIMKTWR